MSSRSGEIAKILTRAIMAQRLLPGAKLGERELAEAMGVSRIVVRQALIRMSEDGIVTIERNRGAFVARLSLQETLQIYEAMTVIEQGAAILAVTRVGTSAWAEIRRNAERQRHAAHESNFGLSDHLGVAFHFELVRLTGNRVLEDMHAQLTRRVTLLHSLYRSEFDQCALADDHLRILDLVERRQIKKAQDLIAEHNRLIVKGFFLEEAETRKPLPLAEALAPYLSSAGPA
ncbi:GntR family transcriptional regulator [Zavarzinia sp.]|uniref:GntR family transcriptional regulator n=1 Tax=Zavarzinia sp. TaxID=2027920 RepID=UPI003566BADF